MRAMSNRLASPLGQRHRLAIRGGGGKHMSGIDGIGDAVTGGLVAGAVEPGHGKVGADGHTRERDCLNCGTRLVGAYCHACGQHGHVHRTLTAFGQDFLSGVLNFEGKILRTIPCLAWQPGKLTRNYIDGQRARFVSPLALFLFTVFLFFAVFQSFGAPDGMANWTDGDKVYHSTDEAITGITAKVAELEADKAQADDEEERARIDLELADQKAQLETLSKIKEQGIGNAILAEASGGDGVETQSDIPMLNEAIQKVKGNPQLALYKIQDATSKFAWALIPISVPFLWLMFPFNRRFRLYDHTVFVTYSLSFMLLLGAVLTLWMQTNISGAGVALALVPPFHMYRQLKGTYGLGRKSAIARTFLLLIFASIASSLFALLVLTVGVVG